MKPKFPWAMTGLGVALTALGISWATLFPPAARWTDDKSAALAELASETNRLKFAMIQARENPNMHGGENAAEAKEKYDEARAAYDALEAEFHTARDSPQAVGRLLYWTGVGMTIIGALTILMAKK